MFEMTKNGEKIVEYEVVNPYAFNNVTVFAGDRYFFAADAKIRNFNLC